MITPYPDIDKAQRKDIEAKNASWLQAQVKKVELVRAELTNRGIQANDRVVLSAFLGKLKADRNISQAVENKSLTLQVADCGSLQVAAQRLSETLDYFRQISALHLALGEAYSATTEKSADVSWEQFRSRLQQDSALLANLAWVARSKIQRQPEPEREEPYSWRDDSFVRLLGIVERVLPGTTAQRIKLAVDLWNIYFHEEFELTDGAAGKLIKKIRRKKSEKSQGN
jgi:hypothetical protein